jgi:hypothetical protein
MAWAGMPAAVRAKVAFLLVFYSIPFSNRGVAVKLYLFGFLLGLLQRYAFFYSPKCYVELDKKNRCFIFIIVAYTNYIC